MKAPIFIALLLLSFISLQAQTYAPNWASLDQRQTPAWFQDAKFGIFIHWGVFSVPAWATTSNADGFGSGYSEWYWQRLFATNLKIHPEFLEFHRKNYGDATYQDFVQQFKAELYKPEDWAKIFEEAGAKYVVLTSKHHEGFTLWPSAQSWNWNAVDVGPHRDLAGDLSKAVKARNLRMGFYYSLYEWFNPVYKADVNKYVAERMLPQMKDLVTRYEPDVLWTDGEWDHPAKTWQSEAFLAWLFNESKVKDRVVVNDRWGNDTKGAHGSFATSEYGHGGTDNKETTNGFVRPWEECRGMGESFGYNRNENLHMYQSGKQLVHQLIDIVARGGNLLLNIGPSADGQIPVIMQERLAEMGAWLKVNGEAIYGTRKWAKAPVYNKESQIYYTQKGQNLYVIQRKWTELLQVDNVAKPKSVRLLGYDGQVKFTYKNNVLQIIAPQLNPNTIPCEYAWTYVLEGVN